MSKSSRLINCTFCGQRGPKSQEDVFPRWLITAIGGNRGVISMSQFSPNVRTEPATTRAQIRGSAAVYKLKDVCHHCNTGWMSRLETAARPTLLPLLNGEPTDLDTDAQTVIGQWAHKTAIAFDAVIGRTRQEPRHIPPAAGTRLFHDTRVVPAGCSVWIGRFSPDPAAGFELPHFRINLMMHNPNSDQLDRAELFTFVFGHLVVQVVVVIAPGSTNGFASYTVADTPLFRCTPASENTVRFPDVSVPIERLDPIFFKPQAG